MSVSGMELEPGRARMEFRQLRYFVTLAEELHGGVQDLVGKVGRA